MSISLNKLAKVKQSNRKRIGRGIGSGKGKTSGRGVKGQKARTGHHSVKGFEGGQTPAHMRLPKQGFTNVLKKKYQVVNISDIANLLEKKLIDESCEVNKDKLAELGIIKNAKLTTKLIMSRKTFLLPKIKILVDTYSKSAEAFKA
jgi:large subunit ribosomal protein L15